MNSNPNDYLKSKLEEYKTVGSNAHEIVKHFEKIIAPWAGKYFNGLILMGSFSQGTAIKKEQDADVDILVSLKPDTPMEIKNVYESLVEYLKSKEIDLELRNISMRTNYAGCAVDFAPAIKMPGKTTFHNVYSRRQDIVMKSNTQKHVELVKKSGFHREIKLLKIWTTCNKVTLDGFLGCLTVMEALKDRKPGDLANNFLIVLHYLADQFPYVRFPDPCNPNDLISDNLTDSEKEKVAKMAKKSLKEDHWNNIIF